MSATVLEGILQSTRAEVARRRREVPLDALRARAAELGADTDTDTDTDTGDAGAKQRQRRFQRALSAPGITVIAEFKRRSPSAGELREGADLPALVGAYERGGAGAISVLTEGPHFAGSLTDLETARAACDLPLLRKDFIVDPYQLHEASAAGADAVLLIVAALAQPELTALRREAGELGLDVLVEVHDRAELGRALDAGADLLGVNNRDLRDFSVDVCRTLELLDHVPAGVTVVSESGISTAAQLRELHRAGVQAVLIGETLMRAPDPEAALQALLDAGARASSGI